MKITYVLFNMLLVLVLCSCKKEIKDRQDTSVQDIYVSGYQNKGTKAIATLWKNGIAAELTDGTKNAYANAVFVLNEDVYVVGNDGSKPIMWKNGLSVDLPLIAGNVSGAASSVYVTGSDIFIAGYQNDGNVNQAVLWKNGETVQLVNYYLVQDAKANAVYAVGNDTFVAGYQRYKTPNRDGAVYWKNRSPVALMPPGNYSVANSIFVQDNDVFVVGHEVSDGRTEAKLWKNNNAFTPLADGTTKISSAESIYISGTNIYIAGYQVNPVTNKYEAKLWENGFETILPLSDGTDFSWARAVYASGVDTYVAGYQNKNGKRIATVWKNKLAITTLTDGTNEAEANGIFVK